MSPPCQNAAAPPPVCPSVPLHAVGGRLDVQLLRSVGEGEERKRVMCLFQEKPPLPQFTLTNQQTLENTASTRAPLMPIESTRMPPSGNRKHNRAHAHVHTHGHTQTHADTRRHTQPHTDTRSHTQPHAATHRHTQPHAATHSHTQTHAATRTQRGCFSRRGARTRSPPQTAPCLLQAAGVGVRH